MTFTVGGPDSGAPGLADASAAFTAAAALTMPAPQPNDAQFDPAGNGVAELVRIERSWFALTEGATARTSEATPLTIAAEKLVPSYVPMTSLTGPCVPLFSSAVIPLGALSDTAP